MAGNQFARYGTYNAVLPKEGPKVFAFNLDFAAAKQQDVDLVLAIQNNTISFVQSWYIDNSKNAVAITVETAGTGQRITIPAGKQAYMPMFIPDEARLTLTTTPAAGLVVPFFVTNVPVTPCVW